MIFSEREKREINAKGAKNANSLFVFSFASFAIKLSSVA
jgi:hypothetical protein